MLYSVRVGSRQALPKETYLVQRCCVVICCGVETKLSVLKGVSLLSVIFQIFLVTRVLLKFVEYYPTFSRGIFSHVGRLDHIGRERQYLMDSVNEDILSDGL